MAVNINHATDTITASSGTLSLPNFSGGGGLTHFVESESTASPNATVPVDAFKATDASYTNIDVALVAKGNGATLAQVPDGTIANGDKRGQYATDLQKIRLVSWHVASGTASVIAGGERNRASNSWASVCGGFLNAANGQYAVVSGGYDNTASSDYSFVGGGQSNIAIANTHAAVCGGNSNTASGAHSFVGGGNTNTNAGPRGVIIGGQTNNCDASADDAVICGGAVNTANSAKSFISGGAYGTTRTIAGYHAFPACNRPIATTQGCTQSALLLLARQTTDATATVLASDNNAAAATNQVTLPNNSAYSFSGEVIAGVTGAGNSARWTIDGAIKRGAGVGTTAMVGTPTVTMTHNDAGAATWVVAVTANTTLGCITVTVTGAAATTIRWVCKINTTEMTY